MQRVLLLSAGWFLMALALLGWILPIMPGYLFFALGLLVLSSEYVWAHKIIQKIRTRFPKMSGKMDGVAHNMTLRLNRLMA